MKKKYQTAAALCICISISMLTGCEKTPEDVIVKEKGADSIAEYESGEETKSPLADTLKAPEHYKNQKSYEDGRLIIDTDADVILPNVNAIDTISVSAQEVNQDMIDKVTKALFDGDKIYDSFYYDEMTKEQVQDNITKLKKFKSEGNMDPYNYGKNEDGKLYYDIDAQIESFEQQYQTAPEQVQKQEVKPQFGLEYPTEEKGETDVREDSFCGTVETENGVYSYDINKGGETKDITFKIEKNKNQVNPNENVMWIEGEYFREKNGEQYIPEDTVKKFVNIPYEEAEKAAKEKAEALGWDQELYGWDYSLQIHGEGVKEENCLDGGYIFYFTRKVKDIPIVYTDNWGGSFESMESTEVPWGYEVCNIIVGDDGIQKIDLQNPYQLGEVQTENVKLMDFDSIIKIYDQMMEVSNADDMEYINKSIYQVNKITLGYTRIYDPKADSSTGLLVPVWDFFGGLEGETKDGEKVKNPTEYSRMSHMTINAIDGTVIDRSLGY